MVGRKACTAWAFCTLADRGSTLLGTAASGPAESTRSLFCLLLQAARHSHWTWFSCWMPPPPWDLRTLLKCRASSGNAPSSLMSIRT